MSEGGDTVASETLHLFQYGSNMARDRFIERIQRFYERYAPPGTPIRVTLLGAARLPDWRLHANLWSANRGCRVVNIIEEPGAEVWGALYELPTALVNRPDGARSLVDRLEGHRTTSDPENYEKVEVIAELDGRSTRAWTYVGLAEAVERCERDYPASMCDTEYIGAVLDGAKAIGLPAGYVSALRKTLVGPTP